MIPTYVRSATVDKDTIHHKWSDWDPYELIPEADDDTILALSSVSLSGRLGFVIGCLEWVTHRCSHDDSYRLPQEYIEAFWLYVAGVEAALPNETTDDDRWEGPLDGPVNLLIGKFYTTIHTVDFGGSPVEAAFSAQVALHVLHDPDPFLRWQTEVLDRLNKHSASDGSEEDFNPIARQLLDPSIEYRSDSVDTLINETLSEIDFKSNRFLCHLSKASILDTNESCDG